MGASGCEVAIPEVAVATERFGRGSRLDGDGVIAGLEPGDQLLDDGFVFADQGALHSALGGVAENIKGRAAQALELSQHLEGGEYPAAEGALLELAGLGVALRQQRRGEVE